LLREGTTAYIEHHDAGEWELYDLATDPHQLTSRRDADVTDLAARLAPLRQTNGRRLRALED
jgi:N-acetylglucosamine-6-sulfatase